MQFALNDEQLLFRDTARAFFDECAGSEALRAALAAPAGYDDATWQRMSRELGWAGIAIAERHGGSGLGMVELAILQHEQGRRLVASPFFATVCLAAPLIAELGSEAQRERWLRRIASGDARFAVGLTGEAGGTGADAVTATVRKDGDTLRLDGACGFVIHGHSCDALLVAARDAPGRSNASDSAGLSVVVVDPAAAGVTIERLTMLDLTRPMARVTFNDVAVDAGSVLGKAGGARAGFERALDRARIALAAECVGSAERVLELTTQYVKERVQFGRAIGSFQAVKHRLADMMVALEAARSASWYAACVADELPDQLAEAASIAKTACSDAVFECASGAIQLHGGIGFTWEHDAHLYFKRARASLTLLGSPSWHRERIARQLGLGETASIPAY
jgi:alkylation response protein AidB-like acyl-CoA dehydrogenase